MPEFITKSFSGNTHWNFLPPAKKLGQGYIFTGVFDSVNRGEAASVHTGITPGAEIPRGGADTPLGADIPWEQTPPSSRLPQQQTPQSRHPPAADTPPGAEHAGRYGQRTGGTHPSGMQSCPKCFY